MSKNHFITRALWLLAFHFVMMASSACAQSKTGSMTPFDYAKAWKQVQEFDDKELPESALKTVTEIYQRARQDNNPAQLVKAVVHQLKYTDYKEEEGFTKNLNRLRKEIDSSSFPVTPLLHSMLAEMYWQYYQNNRYRFQDRTAVANESDEDIKTWSLTKIVSETFSEYRLSLDDALRSKATKIEIFDEILHKGNLIGRRYRPTLYDFLAHRALTFATQGEATISRPASAFVMSDERYFEPSEVFASLGISDHDTASMEAFSLRILQELTRFHLRDEDPEPLADAELIRLAYVYGNHTSPNRKDLYETALKELESRTIRYPISTRATYQRAQLLAQSASLYVPLQGNAHKWDNKLSIELCDSALARFHDSEGAVQCENLKSTILSRSLEASIEETNLPQLPFRALVKYRNFTKLFYRIARVSRTEIQTERNRWRKNYSVDREQKFVEFLATKKATVSGYYTLPDDKDYQEHSLEIKLDGVAAGDYVILLSNRDDFSSSNNALAYAFTTITNLAYMHRIATDGSTDCFVMSRSGGDPLTGVRAEVFNTKYDYRNDRTELVKVGSYTTDKSGYFRIPYLNREERSLHIDFILKDDKASTSPIDRNGYYSGSVNQYAHERDRKTLQTFFFLDRAIYRPGQLIYFKGLVVNKDNRQSSIVPVHHTTVTLYDVNGQVRQEIDVTTNEFGTFNGVFNAPATGLTGQMHITDSYQSGSVYFSVEEYKRPKFEVAWDTIKGSYRLNDSITVSGTAAAFSGAMIDNAKVKYRVVRSARYPNWWGYWRIAPSSPSLEIVQGETVTDANGKFELTFRAIPDQGVDPSTDPAFDFTLYADVTDNNGETHSQTTVVSIGYKSLLLNVPVGDINVEAIGPEGKTISVNTTNFNGQFEPAAGTLVFYRLKQPSRLFRQRMWPQPDRAVFSRDEFYRLFPNDLFEDELNKYKWERDAQVASLKFDTHVAKIVSLPDVKRWTPGEYVLEAITNDKDGKEVKVLSYFTVYSTLSSKPPVHAISYFKPVRLAGEPGETASFVAGTSEKKISVLYELELDGKILTSQWISLHDEQRMFDIPLKEEYRGNIALHYTFVRHGRMFKEDHPVVIPYTNKMLDISFGTFRDKLQSGQQEQWKLLIKGKNADKVMAEMVATLYDESLDSFRPHGWSAQLFGVNQSRLQWSSANGFNMRNLSVFNNSWNKNDYRYVESASFDNLNWFDYGFYSYYYGNRRLKRAGGGALRAEKSMNADEVAYESLSEAEMKPANAAAPSTLEGKNESDDRKENKSDSGAAPAAPAATPVQVRSNFNETAFFYPELRTNEKGEIVINFTVPEALTRWKMLGFAHTRDLQHGFTSNQLVTQKELMVVPNQPRFFREGDKMVFSVKVSSLVDRALEGKARVEFIDPFTGKAIDLLAKGVPNELPFNVAARQSTTVDWAIAIPEGLQATTYRVVAIAGNYSDGEEMTIPVVTNRMLVTETLPLPIRGGQSKDFRFEKLIENKSPTLRHQQFTLEFTSNPAWYAIQALPYLMEYPYDCIEQTFSKFYANSIASHIATSNPRVKSVFDTWKTIQPDALLSKLEKNQELKSALLEETPWVLQSTDETQRKRNVALLFDLNRMAGERERAVQKIIMAQASNGGFPWFPGMPEDRYMTQHIVAGLGHLDRMGVIRTGTDADVTEMLRKAVLYLDGKIADDYQQLTAMAAKKQIKLDDQHIGYTQVHYLYARSYFTSIEIPRETREAFDYYFGQAKKYWQWKNIYIEGLSALALSRFGDQETPAAMIRSFKERALNSDEMGMYWKSDRGYYWFQAPIETQALMIEVFDEVAKDNAAVEALKVWLLKQKQTQDWKTTKATSEACYALLMRGSDLLSSTNQVEITVGKERVDPAARPDTRVEAGTGYFKTSWQTNEITSDMGKIHIAKKDNGVAWGAVYWQYFEQMDKITAAATPLSLKKQLFITVNGAQGTVLKPITEKSPIRRGDLITVRIEIRVDRDMEYVHLKDMRASGFEPVSTLSTYRYQDGLHYYESPRDIATHFFIGYLPTGTYVFEYQLRASQRGEFSNGITTMQCMYAPEFTSHSPGIRVSIE